MKRLFVFLLAFCSMATVALADGLDDVSLTASKISKESGGNNNPRTPIHVPSASIDDHTFYVNGGHPDYVFQLVDINDEETVLYEVPMPAGVNSVPIPSVYTGEYRVQLIWGNWYFWGYVDL